MTRPSLRTSGSPAEHLDAAIDAILDGRSVQSLEHQRKVLELLTTARLLHESLPRFHPRFGFEERLAARLRGGMADVVPFPAAAPVDPRPMATSRRRGLVASGAIASGLSLVLPLAGAALVAWRRSRPTGGI
jgi:hypothetical protein